jgi:hypothetical protein
MRRITALPGGYAGHGTNIGCSSPTKIKKHVLESATYTKKKPGDCFASLTMTTSYAPYRSQKQKIMS